MEESYCSPAAISMLSVFAAIFCWCAWVGWRVSRFFRVLVPVVAQGDRGVFAATISRYGWLLRLEGDLACSLLELIITHNRVDFLPVLLQYRSAEKMQTYRLEYMDPSLLAPAVTKGSPEMLDALLEAGFDPMRDVESLWMVCCMSRSVAHAGVLVKHGADIISPVHREVLQEAGEFVSPLHAVVAGAYSEPGAALEMVRYLIGEHGDNVNERTAGGCTALDLLEDEPLRSCVEVAPLREFLRSQGALYAGEQTNM